MNTLVRIYGHLYGHEDIDKTYCYVSAEGADIEAFIAQTNKGACTGYYYTIAETAPTEAQPIGLYTMCNMKSGNPDEYNKIIAPLAWQHLSEAQALRRMNDLIIAKGYTKAQAHKEVRKIDREMKFLNAVDEVCGSCYYCEEDFCRNCPVRKTVDKMREA